MPDTLPRLNLDDARAVLGKMTRGPWALEQAPFVAAGETFERTEANAEGIVYCVNNFGVLVEEVAQLRAAITVEKKINEYANHTERCFGDQAQWWNNTSFEECQRTPVPCSCGYKLACEARAALSPAPIAQQSPKTKD